MLINCPECEHRCSDKAFSCPSCGYPFKVNMNTAAKRSNRKKRLPNGFGQISEIKRMVGHAISDITEQVYTHRDLDWFISEIEKIK